MKSRTCGVSCRTREASVNHGSSLKCTSIGSLVLGQGSAGDGFTYLPGLTAFGARFRLRLRTSAATKGFFGMSAGPFLCLGTDSTGKLRCFSGGSWQVSTTTLAIDTWYLIEVSRTAAGAVKVFVDGAVAMDLSNTTALPANFQIALGAEPYASSTTSESYIEDFEFISAPINTAAYTAPTDSFMGAIAGTVKDAAGTNIAREVLALPRDAALAQQAATSDGTTGAFSFFAPKTAHTVIVRDQTAGNLNALVFDRVTAA